MTQQWFTGRPFIPIHPIIIPATCQGWGSRSALESYSARRGVTTGGTATGMVAAMCTSITTTILTRTTSTTSTAATGMVIERVSCRLTEAETGSIIRPIAAVLRMAIEAPRANMEEEPVSNQPVVQVTEWLVVLAVRADRVALVVQAAWVVREALAGPAVSVAPAP